MRITQILLSSRWNNFRWRFVLTLIVLYNLIDFLEFIIVVPYTFMFLAHLNAFLNVSLMLLVESYFLLFHADTIHIHFGYGGSTSFSEFTFASVLYLGLFMTLLDRVTFLGSLLCVLRNLITMVHFSVYFDSNSSVKSFSFDTPRLFNTHPSHSFRTVSFSSFHSTPFEHLFASSLNPVTHAPTSYDFLIMLLTFSQFQPPVHCICSLHFVAGCLNWLYYCRVLTTVLRVQKYCSCPLPSLLLQSPSQLLYSFPHLPVYCSSCSIRFLGVWVLWIVLSRSYYASTKPKLR